MEHVISPEDYAFGERYGVGRFGSGDTLTVRDGLVWSSETSAILAQPLGGTGYLGDLDMRLFGLVVSEAVAIDLWSAVTEVHGSDIYLGTPGFVGGFSDGIVLRGGSDNEIVNRGGIGGTRNAIAAGGDDLRIENHGGILTYGDEIGEAPRYHAISILYGDATITNTGFILGVDLGLSASRQAAIRVGEDAELDLRNDASGLIWAGDGTSIRGGSMGDTVVNRGAIHGDVVLGTGDDEVRNFGEIGSAASGDVLRSEVRLGGGDDVLVNRGTIWGDIDLGSGDDRYEETFDTDGRGAIRGGRGDDTYVVKPLGDLEIVERRGEGFDTVRSFGSIDAPDHVERIVLLPGYGDLATARGNDTDNEIVGRAWEDHLRGGRGADQLRGRDGDDDMFGGRGWDLLKGGQGDDWLRGDRGEDVLKGGRGSDRLIGGKGGDKLVGGRGADTFIWRSEDEAGVGRDQRDVVTDFDAGFDSLRLRRLNLEWRDGRFSGEGAEVRAVEKGGDTILKMDVDADARTDMKIVLRGVMGLSEDDLVL